MPSREIRCGQDARAIASPTTVGPEPGHVGERARVRHAGAAQRAAHGAVEPLHQARSAWPGVTRKSCAGASGSASEPVAVTIVCPIGADSLTQRAAAALVELRERVVEEQERRHAAALADQLGLGEEQREHGEPLLALRAERAEVAVAAPDRDLVQVRAGAGRAPLEVAGEPLLELA